MGGSLTLLATGWTLHALVNIVIFHVRILSLSTLEGKLRVSPYDALIIAYHMYGVAKTDLRNPPCLLWSVTEIAAL